MALRQRRAEPGRIRDHEVGDRLRCMVLAGGPDEWAAADVASGAIVRARPGAGPLARSGRRPAGVTPLDLVEIVLAEDGEPPDPGRPEAVAFAAEPEPLGRLRTWQARRLLAGLVARTNVRPLLGTVGPAVSYGDLDGTRPSIVVVEPARGPELVAVDGRVWATFGLAGRDERLPVLDTRACTAATAIPGTVLTRSGSAAMLGFDPRYLVVALVPPIHGHARKTVIGLLPRP